MKLTVTQLRRIIKEEVSRVMEMGAPAAGAPKKKAPRRPGVDAETKQAAQEIADIVGQGTAGDYLSVAKVVTDLLNYRYPDHESVEPIDVISDELANVVSDSGEALDFDAFGIAQVICDEFML